MDGNGNGNANGNAAVLERMASSDPELAARLMLMSLPAAAAPLPSDLEWRLDLEGLGSWMVKGGDGAAATVKQVEAGNGAGPDPDFVVSTDAAGLARLGAGSNPLGLMLRRRLRLRGNRRKAMAMRRMDGEADLRALARLGAPIDPDVVYRSLAHAIEPEWTAGHHFKIAYELEGEGGGRWVINVDDGSVTVRNDNGGGAAARAADRKGDSAAEPNATVHTTVDVWTALLRGDLTPASSMQARSTTVNGELYPVTLLGRWIDRAAGEDDAELERERRQSEIQQRRLGTWGSNGHAANGGPIDPAQGKRDNLLTYEQLYALWEQRNWRAHELDFSVDREQWLVSPEESQRHTAHTMGSFYVGEERVAADLAPFMLAAPSGEIETFLATQLVDESRHAVFFDRWAAEVMALSADDLRGRLKEAEEGMLTPWHFLFDDSLRDVANRLLKKPDDLELFVEGIVIYHMVTEGVLAMTGQRSILQYLSEHSMYPGFQKGFSLVEQDEHRHIAFGVRFLRDVCQERPEMKHIVLDTIERLLPEAAKVFAPPGADPVDFTSYAFHSSQVYGYAYEALRRRMNVVGVEIPGPERLMPGPIDPAGLQGTTGNNSAGSSASRPVPAG